MNDLCPVCECGRLEPSTVTETIKFNGRALSVEGIQISLCPECGEEVVTAEQARTNDVLFSDAKRASAQLLKPAELKAVRKRHNLTQAAAAALFGGGTNAFSKYERGEVIQSRSMDLLIRLFDQLPAVRSCLSPKVLFAEGWANESARGSIQLQAVTSVGPEVFVLTGSRTLGTFPVRTETAEWLTSDVAPVNEHRYGNA